MRKYCTDCKYHKLEVAQHPHAQGQYMKMYICTHTECSDPVDASPIPCGISRKEPTLCGLNGKYWEQDKKEPDPKSNVITMLKD